MLADELYSVIHVSRLEYENAAELFLGFRIWTICRYHFAVLPGQSQRSFRRLERFATSPVPVGAKMFVVFQACIEHSVSLALTHAIEFVFIIVAKTEVLHCSSPHPGSRNRQQIFAPAPPSRHYRLITCFRRILIREPGRKEARAPRPGHRRRWRPSSPM
jgi:hypothetical protein